MLLHFGKETPDTPQCTSSRLKGYMMQEQHRKLDVDGIKLDLDAPITLHVTCVFWMLS